MFALAKLAELGGYPPKGVEAKHWTATPVRWIKTTCDALYDSDSGYSHRGPVGFGTLGYVVGAVCLIGWLCGAPVAAADEFRARPISSSQRGSPCGDATPRFARHPCLAERRP